MKGFLGLLLLFGVMKRSHIEVSHLWSPDSIHYSSFATATMSRDRFKILSACISFDDASTREARKKENKKFYKISEIFEMFRLNIKEAFTPGHHLCVDETLCF